MGRPSVAGFWPSVEFSAPQLDHSLPAHFQSELCVDQLSKSDLPDSRVRTLVMPAFEHYLLREITVRQGDQFIKTLAATKSCSMAMQAQTVSLTLGLAVRYDAMPKNPGDTTRLHKPPS